LWLVPENGCTPEAGLWLVPKNGCTLRAYMWHMLLTNNVTLA